ncbi:aldo/keto reductase-like protein [Cadophora sp. DSE1049]|nr:aldo/keto reductase-like protein [Cadophora sp. DSE1049]
MAPSQVLPTRTLGKSGPEVPALRFGLMGLSAFYGTPESDEERFKILDRAYDLVETFWDSADIYQDSEDLVGKVDSTPQYCKQACEKSLKRLGVEQIDLYYCHRVDQKTPIEKTAEAMVELKKEGKIKYLGLSEISSDTLRRACKVHHIDAVQIEYSPFSIEVEQPQVNLLNTCRELGVATVAYSPLGRGMLTGAFKSADDFGEGDFRKFLPRFSTKNFPRNLKLVDGLVSLAKKKGCTPGQLTLAWLLAQGDNIIPIPGTKKIKYLEENLGSLDVHLTRGELQDIRQLVESAEVHGTRYPEASMASLFADTPGLEA